MARIEKKSSKSSLHNQEIAKHHLSENCHSRKTIDPLHVWPPLSPLVIAALADPEKGLLVLDPQLRLVHITGPVQHLLGLSEELIWSDLDLSGSLSQTDLDCTSVASAKSAVLQAEDKEPLEPVSLFRNDNSHEIWMRAHEIGQQHLVVTFAAVSGNPSAEVKVGETAQRDALTGLLTRLYFEKAVVSALTQATNRTLAVLLIDLDRFKPVNDTLGHIAGDTGLRLVANRLQSVIRETDSIARLGGDEFALMIHPLSPATDPANLARRIVDLLGRTYLIDGHLVNIGASVGIAVAPRDGTQYESLLRCADLALHHSKIVGRGTYHFFSAEMDARAQARRTGELDLRQALALRQFEVHYQPQIDIKTRGLVGFEALVRWRHPEKGLIPPGDFLALAEEINVIIPLGDWVLTTACREAMKWPDSVVVAVNASPIQFETGRFADSVRSALDGTKLPARRLEIEVTEGVLLREKQAVLDTLRDLRSMGVRIAMDDFGTGHASLSQLARFSYDKIKIDRSLVGPDRDNTKNRAIVRAISALGASLGISTMAEGIETEDQLERIERDGCGSVQGYLFSKPMPASQLEKVISDLLAKSLLTKSGVMESQNELQPI